MERFKAEKYREDFARLTHRIIDRENGAVIDEAMEPGEARQFAATLNSLWREYRNKKAT